MAKNNKKWRDYWKRRNNELLSLIDSQDINIYNELIKVYGDTALDIQKDLFSFFQQFSENNQLTIEQAKEILRGQDLSDYQANARRYYEYAETLPEREREELLARLNEQYISGRVQRLDALNLDITYELGRMNSEYLQPLFKQHLENIARLTYDEAVPQEFTENINWEYGSGGNSDSNFNRFNYRGLSPYSLEEVLSRKWNGYDYSEAIWGNTDNLAQKLKDTLAQGFIRGESVQNMAREIRNDFDTQRHRAETLVRTDGTHVVSEATIKRYQDFGLTRYKLNVHLDNRTTKICRDLHELNAVYLLSEAVAGETAPPFHRNCRTGMIPDEEELYEEHWIDDLDPDDLTAA